jgi:catechol 2,3-dioxygenase-like lactoylglutathione lyase family enzyme
MSPPNLYVGSIVIDCDDFDRMLSFWSAALGYVPKRPPDGGWVILKDPNGKGPNVSLNHSQEGHSEQYRLHLDLYAKDQKGEVARLRQLGASLVREPNADEDFVVLADPDGNPFCVIDAGPGLD